MFINTHGSCRLHTLSAAYVYVTRCSSLVSLCMSLSASGYSVYVWICSCLYVSGRIPLFVREYAVTRTGTSKSIAKKTHRAEMEEVSMHFVGAPAGVVCVASYPSYLPGRCSLEISRSFSHGPCPANSSSFVTARIFYVGPNQFAMLCLERYHIDRSPSIAFFSHVIQYIHTYRDLHVYAGHE